MSRPNGKPSDNSERIALILAGGMGTRLWPLSRRDYPKQFIKIAEKESTYQAALRRASAVTGDMSRVYIVTAEGYRFHVLGQAREIGIELREENIILEPLRRDTAPAILYGMKRALLSSNLSEATVIVFPSDHLIRNDSELFRAVELAAEAAERGYISLVGVQPDRPEPGYGYIKAGDPILTGVYEVTEFIEKPGAERAKQMLEEGSWFWSTMIMAFKSSLMERKMREHLPGVYLPLSRVDQGVEAEKVYADTQKIDISSGLLSKCAKELALVPTGNLGWSDLGSFDAIYDLLEKNGWNNAIDGKSRTVDSHGNLVLSERLVALVDVNDMIVVDSGDAILICPRGSGQKVKALVQRLLEGGAPEVLRHREVYTEWGTETTLLRGEGYEVRGLRVDPGKGFGPHRHFHRSEYLSVLRGTAEVVVDGKEHILTKGEGVYIPVGALHSLRNPGKMPLEVIEIATGEYLGYDDFELVQPEGEKEAQE